MSSTATEIYNQSRALLNDTGAQIMTNAVLLPYLQKAHLELVQKLQLNGAQVLSEQSAVIEVTALATTLTLPADFLRPIELWERADNSGAEFEPMFELEWEADSVQPTDKLLYWAFREQQIQFLGATVNREVRLRYTKALPTITGDSSPSTVTNGITFLAARTAELAARYISKNYQLADSLVTDQVTAMSILIRNTVRDQINLTGKMKPYRYSQKLRRSLWR